MDIPKQTDDSALMTSDIKRNGNAHMWHHMLLYPTASWCCSCNSYENEQPVAPSVVRGQCTYKLSSGTVITTIPN
jgi:hypothetical protein